MGSKNKLRKWPTKHGIRHELLQKTLIIGHLRHLSKMDDLNLRFEGLNFEKFVDRNTLEVDISEMIRRVLNLRRIPGLFENDIRERLSSVLKEEDDDPYQICYGHDFVTIFAIALRKVLGSKTSKDASPANLGMLLRLAYDRSDFHRTELYSRAKLWSKRNFGYDIFA